MHANACGGGFIYMGALPSNGDMGLASRGTKVQDVAHAKEARL